MEQVRLTTLAHGGGCGCKIAPSVLQNLLATYPSAKRFPQLLVGLETGDDAAVWRIDDRNCLIATTDFFMPMVDDPFEFGRIAATNAISDVYAMGGAPIFALAVLGVPIGKLAADAIRGILEGGASVAAAAGIPIAGGHSIDAPEPFYGLAVIGSCLPQNVRTNAGARPGDALVLTKPLGVGVYSAAFKKGALGESAYRDMIASMTRLNDVGVAFGESEHVHAMTDVTGFGLIGHAVKMAEASDAWFVIDATSVPYLAEGESLAKSGFVTGASGRNWASYASRVELPDDATDWLRDLLTDPQTSGGLLVACAGDQGDKIRRMAVSAGHAAAAVIGRVEAGSGGVAVTM